MQSVEVVAIGRVDQLAGLHSAQLVDRVPEEDGGGFVGIGEPGRRIADQNGVGALRVQFAVVPLALREPVHELGVAQGDRRGPSEHPKRLHLGVVEGGHVGAPHAENAANRAVVVDRREDDRSCSRREAARDLGPGRRAQHGDVAAEHTLVAECRVERESLALELRVGSFAHLEVGELLVDRRE